MVFNNIYEMITPPSVVKTNWFVDYFDGDGIKSWWNIKDGGGGSSVTMDDNVDEGLKIVTGTGTQDMALDFNFVNHYDPNSMSFEIVAKNDNSDFGGMLFGFGNIDLDVNIREGYVASLNPAGTNIKLRNHDGGANSLDTGVAVDTNWHRYNGTVGATATKLKQDSILIGTNSTRVPDQKAQPAVWFNNIVTGSRTFHFRYWEAYNK